MLFCFQPFTLMRNRIPKIIQIYGGPDPQTWFLEHCCVLQGLRSWAVRYQASLPGAAFIIYWFGQGIFVRFGSVCSEREFCKEKKNYAIKNRLRLCIIFNIPERYKLYGTGSTLLMIKIWQFEGGTFKKLFLWIFFRKKSPMLLTRFERNLNEYGSTLNKLELINLNVLLPIE